jgi:hypothetical protein
MPEARSRAPVDIRPLGDAGERRERRGAHLFSRRVFWISTGGGAAASLFLLYTTDYERVSTSNVTAGTVLTPHYL